MASNLISPPSTTKKKRLNLNTVEKAVKALLKWKKLKKTQSLTDPQQKLHDDYIYLLVTLKKVPSEDRRVTHKVPLLHPLEDSLLYKDVCLIIDDRPVSNPKFKLTAEAANQKIKKEGVPITKVLKFTKLRSDYKSFEAKKELYDMYDMFFADKRVVDLLPKILGKQFYVKKKKVPVEVELGKSDWKEEIERAWRSVLLCLSSGTCSMVKVGKDSMERNAIIENVVKAIDEVVEVVPRKWAGVKSFHLKFTESLALPIYQLPIYQSLPDMKLGIEGKKDIVEVKEKMKRSEGEIAEKVQYSESVGVAGDGEKRDSKELGSGDIVGKKRKDGVSMISRNKRLKIDQLVK